MCTLPFQTKEALRQLRRSISTGLQIFVATTTWNFLEDSPVETIEFAEKRLQKPKGGYERICLVKSNPKEQCHQLYCCKQSRVISGYGGSKIAARCAGNEVVVARADLRVMQL